MALPLPILNQPVDMLLGPDNDIVVSATDVAWAYDIHGVAQLCRIAVQIFRDEWFANLDIGIEYYDGILGAKESLGVVRARAAYRRELLAQPGVIDVPILNTAFDGGTRVLTVSWVARTAFGDTPLDTISKRVSTGATS